MQQRQTLVLVAFTCTALIVLGYFLSPAGPPTTHMALGNRLLAISACWISAILVRQAQRSQRALESEVAERTRAEEELRRLTATLEVRVAERTKELATSRTAALNMMEDAEEARRKAEQAEAALRKSAEAIRDLYNNAPCGYHSLDKDGVFVAINDTELQWLGYTRDQVIGNMKASDFLTPESQAIFHATFPRFKAEGSVRDLEFEMVRKDGTILPVLLNATAIMDAEGKYVSSRSTVFDITARKRAEEERDRFFMLSLDMLCIAHKDGHFKRVSPAFTQTLGWSNEELLARPFLDFVHPDDRAATLREVERQVVGGEKVLQFENRYRHKDGSWRILSWKSVPQPDGTMYATARDITERKRQEETLHELNRELERRGAALEEANKELEAFAYSVSHDLRAPLRHIDGFTDLLRRHLAPSLDEKGARYLQTISDSAKQMGRLIDDLLIFSRMGRAEMRLAAVPLDRLVKETLNDLKPDTDGRTIAWHINSLPTVQGDPSMLKQVFLNLIGNAVKYTGPRERAVIEVGRLEQPPASETVIYVKDNGVGFDMQYAHKLFGVFQRLHSANEFEGTGIGLANVRRIVHRHGGRTWAEGEVGKGATFYFSLPGIRGGAA
ncbi:MAG: PAS domain S-box protein [Nitrospirota bacterium]